MVLVKKDFKNGRMCVDYTNLNRECPKDSYPLPNINLVDISNGYKILPFMDAKSSYNEIHMYMPNRDKPTFRTKQANYQYNVMPFNLKNTGETYHRMMNKVF